MSYCVHGKKVEHAVSGAGTVCVGPFTRSATDPAIIPSERPDTPRVAAR